MSEKLSDMVYSMSYDVLLQYMMDNLQKINNGILITSVISFFP